MKKEKQWSEKESDIFINLGGLFVPDRKKQWSIITDLLHSVKDLQHIYELGCGSGEMAQFLLDRLPDVKYTGMDLSEAMLKETRANLKDHHAKAELKHFDLGAYDWRSLRSVDAFISSLVIHHLAGQEKKVLYQDLFKMLRPGGVLIIADIVMPSHLAGISIAAKNWDQWVQKQIREKNKRPDLFDFFKKDGWNFFDDPAADPIDKPSGVLEQLRWLEMAGFDSVDIWWMDAGHAIFGGWK